MSDGKRRVLFYSEGWGTGGIETFVMNAMRALDGANVTFDVFCTHDYDEHYDDEIAQHGGTRYTVFKGCKPGLGRRLISSSKAWRELLMDRSYDVVHINTMNGMGFVYASIAKEVGVPIRIVHSHNTDFGEGHRAIKGLAHRLGKTLWSHTATHRLACSAEAGRYLFDRDSFTVVNNAIDVSRFRYSSARRSVIREANGIDSETFVVGNVGRLSEQKNPTFLIEVFFEVLRGHPNSCLFLVGQGPLEEMLRVRIDELGIAEKVKHIKASDDIPSLMSAMDLFCLPSRHEGLAIVAVEAQASGLPLVASSAVSKETALIDSTSFVDSGASPGEWARAIMRAERATERCREEANNKILATSYTLPMLSRKLREVYRVE